MACLIASSTATVRDGSAPAAPVRNADCGVASEIMYRISYMTEFRPYAGAARVSNLRPGVCRHLRHSHASSMEATIDKITRELQEAFKG